MFRHLLIILLFCLFPLPYLQAGQTYRFRVYLKDKGQAGYEIERPEAYLSKDAIERRMKNKVAITADDFPIAPDYIDSLSSTGAEPVVRSKWFGTVVMESADSTAVDRLRQLPIVDSVKWVWKGELRLPVDTAERTRLIPSEEPLRDTYGYAAGQINMLNGVKLHEAGFQGQGMRVAVIDAGFMNVDRISAFDSMKLIGTQNIVFPGQSVFVGDDHGTKVLSCMAANLPGLMVGTAPQASYLLIKSEDSDSEYPIEEDYWAAAIEYADSVGVDVITSSLGYFEFDADELSFRHADLNGRTTLISRAANLAAGKGMWVFCSAGNEGNGEWEKITFPSDADQVFTVGAIDTDKTRSNFSSVGFTADGRVKPDAVALGSGCCVIDPSGRIGYANGTSFATPILAGMGVCLWQALPGLSNREMTDLLQRNSSKYNRPNTEVGYGIPDLYKALKKGSKYASRTK